MTATASPLVREELDLIARRTLEDEARISSAFPYSTRPHDSRDMPLIQRAEATSARTRRRA